MEDISEVIDFGGSRKAASIKVIGIGGGGGNAANHMYDQGIKDVDFVVCNTDIQDLQKSKIPTKIQLGKYGRGCGSNAEKGETYAKESTAEIESLLEDTQMVFITAGMGGGTGTGAAPVIAEIAKKKDILTVAVVTIPFQFEGRDRYDNAVLGIEALRQNVDSMLVINNQTLREKYGDLTISQAFYKADDILAVAVRSIAEIMTVTGIVNVDFEDVLAVMQNSGVAVMASGSGTGENRAFDAIEETLDSPLLNKADIRGAKKILLNLTSGKDNEITLDEQSLIMEYIRQKAENEVSITYGYVIDQDMQEEIRITLIATGFEMNDLPAFHKVEIPVTYSLHSTDGNVTAKQDLDIKQSEPVFNNGTADITINNSKQFDYGKVRKMKDISQYENQSAYNRTQKENLSNLQSNEMQSMTKTQETAIAVANRIKGDEELSSVSITIDKNSKGIKLDSNKYLNHNVD